MGCVRGRLRDLEDSNVTHFNKCKSKLHGMKRALTFPNSVGEMEA